MEAEVKKSESILATFRSKHMPPPLQLNPTTQGYRSAVQGRWYPLGHAQDTDAIPGAMLSCKDRDCADTAIQCRTAESRTTQTPASTSQHDISYGACVFCTATHVINDPQQHINMLTRAEKTICVLLNPSKGFYTTQKWCYTIQVWRVTRKPYSSW